MPTTIQVHFLHGEDVLAGELVNPYSPDYEQGAVNVEFVGDNEVDVLVFRSDDLPFIFRTHISRVASMKEVVLT